MASFKKKEDDTIFTENDYIGIVNMGNTCYLSSAIQLILSISGVIQELSECPINDTFQRDVSSGKYDDIVYEIIRALKILYGKKYRTTMADADDTIQDPDEIKILWKPTSLYNELINNHTEFEFKMQEDADEAISVILNAFEESNLTSNIWKEKIDI